METNIDIYAQNVVELLLKAGLRTASAESCTGGLISAAITSVSGSSAVFELGMCTYSEKAKELLLGVPRAVIEQYGVVSGECAEAMAQGALKAADSHFAVSTTGVAGPTGGTEQNPVGTVYIGVADRTGSFAVRFVFSAENCPKNLTKRDFIRLQAAEKALELLTEQIEKYHTPKLSP